MDSLNKGKFFEIIVYNQQNNIAADQWNVWICAGGWGISKNSSVDSNSSDKSDVNETADQQIVWINLRRVFFGNDSV